MQHGVFNPQHIAHLQVGQHQVDLQVLALGAGAIQAGGHGFQEAFDRRLQQHVHELRLGRALARRAVAQFVRCRQVAVAPGRGLRHIAHLVVGLGQQLLGRLVGRVAEHRVVQQLCRPAVVALVERGLRGRDRLVGATNQFKVALGRLLRRQRVQVGRVAVVGTQVELVDRLDVVAQVAVVAARAEESLQRCGQLHHVRNFLDRVAGIDQAHRLVVRVLVDIAVHGDELLDVGLAPDRPVVRGDVGLGILGLFQRLVQVAGPAQRIAHLGAAHRQQVVHGLRQVLGAVVQLPVGQAERQLGRAFGAGHVVEHKVQAIDLQGLRRLVDQAIRLDDADGAVGHVLAQAGVHIALGRARQVAAELVQRAAAHRGADHDVFAGGLFHQAFGRDDGNLALGDFLRGHDAQHAAEMVGVGMRDDHGRHRFVAQVLARKGQRRGRSFLGGQRVDDDPAGLAFDQRHVGNVKAAQLVDMVHHLEQAEVGVELRMAPQAGVDGVGRGAGEEVVGVEVFQHRAIGQRDLARGLGDEAALGVFEVLLVGQRQVFGELRIGGHGGGAGVAGGAADAGVLAAAGQRECSGQGQ